MGRGYWYRRTAKELYVPFYLMRGSDVTLKIVNENGDMVHEQKLNADRGLNFASWDLLGNKEEMVESGSYKLQLMGPNFKEEKDFKIEASRRRR
jgi:flagellar hook assembly protein FlgD